MIRFLCCCLLLNMFLWYAGCQAHGAVGRDSEAARTDVRPLHPRGKWDGSRGWRLYLTDRARVRGLQQWLSKGTPFLTYYTSSYHPFININIFNFAVKVQGF